MLFSNLWVALRALAFFSIAVHAANWNTDVGILVTERLDPIVSPNGVAQHMHSIIGGSAFSAAYNYPDLIKSSCSSFPISVDKSNYWHPKPYWINNNGSSFTPLPIQDRVYYIREQNSPNEPIQPFPEGLRMIVGNPNAKSGNGRSFQYLCRVADKFDGPGDIWSDNWQFERDCPKGILAQHKFPPCWNGKDLYKSDQSHMAYPQYDAFYGACPASHPIRLPGIMLEALILTSRWAPGETVKGKLAWANGDTTGFGIHADFINGWDTEVLRRALVDPVCSTSDDITFQECPVFQPFMTSGKCQPERGVLTESFAHNDLVPITRLPGCNPIWSTGSKPGCTSTLPDPDPSAFTGTDGPKVVVNSTIPSLPTLPGWKQISCIKDSDNMLLNKTRSYDNSVSQTTCLDACLRSGYTYASIGRAWGTTWVCDCGTGLDPAASVFPGMCNLTCPTNSSQGCGGSGAHSVFYAPNNTSTFGNYSTSLGCYASPAAGKTGLEQMASYSFNSWNLMTRDLCGQGCADRGLDWAAIRSGDTCFCGTKANLKIGDGNYVNEATCTSKCTGDKSQTCGYWGGLSVFDVAASGYKGATLNKPPGYIQCFSDNSRKSLTSAQYYDANLTPQRCQFGCRDLGYSLAAVHGGGMCLCGNSMATVSILPTSMCSSKCTDSSANVTCGGPGNGELYNTSVVAAEVQSFNAKRPAGWQGCFANSANNVTADFTVNESKMTATRCIAACNELGYGWAGLQNREQCRCSTSDPRKNTAAVAAINFCAIPCNGNADQRCGGWGYVDLYKSPVNSTQTPVNGTDNGVPTLPGYQGCFNGSQPLATYNWWSASMTVDLCTKSCTEIGQPLAALNYGTCSCGPKWNGGVKLSSLSCGQPCAGDSSQRCGGWPGQSSVYASSVGQDTAQPQGYLGCWQETNPKAVQGFGQWLDGQSVDGCRAVCSAKNFALAGLSNGKQCWCGNSLSSASNRIPSQYCSNPCPGNNAQNCGQWNSVALYRSSGDTDGFSLPRNVNGTITAPSSSSSIAASISVSSSISKPASTSISSSVSRSASPSASSSSVSISSSRSSGSASSTGSSSLSRSSSSSTTSSGSTSSSASSRTSSATSSASCSAASSSAIVSSTSTSSASVALASCISDIKTLNATIYSSSFMTQDTCLFWCQAKGFAFAGVSANSCSCGNTRPTIAATTCSTRCSGNSAQLCGGSNAATLLSTSTTSGFLNPYSTPDSTGYLGCWTDSNTRLLPSSSFSNSAMTRSICLSGCQTRGFKYAGLQHSTQCYCANEINAVSTNWRTAESECSAKCGGDTTQACGGSWRMSVWAVDNTLSVSSSSSSSSSAMIPTSASSSIVFKPSASSTATTPTMSSSASSSTSSSKSSSSTSSSPQSSSQSPSSSTSASFSSKPSTSSASSTLTTSSTTTSTSSTPVPSSLADEYLGCFVDQNPRSLRNYTYWTNTMTPQLCRDTCKSKGFEISGTSNSKECFCGDSAPTSKKVADTECSSVCAGGGDAKCGGWWRLSVYGPGGVVGANASTPASATGVRSRKRSRSRVWQRITQ